MQAMVSLGFLLEMMWFQKHDICGLPQANTYQSSIRFTHLTYPFIQGLSHLQKNVANLTLMLSTSAMNGKG